MPNEGDLPLAACLRKLSINRFMELIIEMEIYFGNYKRVVFLTQTGTAEIQADAARAADKIGLPLEVTVTGYGQLETEIVEFGKRRPKSSSKATQPAAASQ